MILTERFELNFDNKKMLKQSLIQEKLSDLTTGNSTSNGSAERAKAELIGSSHMHNMPQWPRVQIDKHITSNLKRNTKILINTVTSSSSPTTSIHTTTMLSKSAKTYRKSNENLDLNDLSFSENEFEGNEMVNYYTNYGRFDLNPKSSNYNNHSGQLNLNHTNEINGFSQANEQRNVKSSQYAGDRIVSDSSFKLKYLEKSIRFIQQQHVDTLNGLHQEIDKLKNENRELHFKLATRKTPQDNSLRTSTELMKASNMSPSNDLKDPIFQKGFDKALKDASKEANLDKRLTDLKLNYESSKYEELQTRLKDAESKNEYLTSIIAQLQSKRSVNSGYRLNDNSKNHNSVNNNNNVKINLNHIYTIEPLRIKMSESEEPRAPNLEESEIIIKKLFELYKQQKQQISNMKVVLKDVMQTENLSNQGIMMTKDILENPNKLGQYFIDSGLLPKLSMVTPFMPQSGRSNVKNHSQYLISNNNNQQIDMSSVSASSTVHLPPLQAVNPAKFPERQRRTQILQRQRLRKEYFH